MDDNFPGTIKVTAAAPTLLVNGQNYSIPGLTPAAGGGNFSFPITEDYVGFLVQDDAGEEAGAPGTFTMSVTLGSN
jgi:hypothetical protein